MVEKVESFVRRLRWKAYHFCKEHKENNSNQCKNFGLETVVTPPQNEDLNAFENNIYDIIRNVEFTNIRNEFLDHLNRDIESTRSSKNVLVFADKSTNLFELSCENYQKLLHNNITKTHKKTPKNAKWDIDGKTKSFAKTLKIEEMIECYADQHAYITLKDHQENFMNLKL